MSVFISDLRLYLTHTIKKTDTYTSDLKNKTLEFILRIFFLIRHDKKRTLM